MPERSAVLLVISSLFCSLFVGFAGGESRYESIGRIEGFYRVEDGVMFDCTNASVHVALLAPDVVRFRVGPRGIFVGDYSWAVNKREWEGFDWDVRALDDIVQISTSGLEICLQRDPFMISILDKEGNVISRDAEPMAWRRSEEGYETRCAKEMPLGEHYYGLGEKSGFLDKRRSNVTMWNTDAYGYGKSTDPLYKSIPFFIGLRDGKAYGIFFDNSYRTYFDMGASFEDRYLFGSDGGEIDYYFFYGPEVKDVVGRYTELTGRMPMPPLWALGHQMSRYSYYPADRILEIAKRCREEGIPTDTIYLDIDYHEGFKPFTWDEERFPDPEGLLTALEEMGFKVIAIVDPAIKVEEGYEPYEEGIINNYFIRLKNGTLYRDNMWPGISVWPDFTRDDVREWWGGLYDELIDQGVDSIWNDMNEPAVFNETREPKKTMVNDTVFWDHGLNTTHRKNHNVYALTEVMGTYEGLLDIIGEKRPFVLSRAGYSGIQRYAATWTGDNTASWEHLALQTPMFLNMGLSGLAFTGSDIGGFIGSPSPELLVRWYEASVFAPLFRDHTAKGTYDQEPWVFGDYYEGIIRDYVELRYRLLPYLYTLVYEAHTTGYPVLRPLFFEFQGDDNTYSIQDEFMVGSDILVAPVVSEGADERLVYLPEGLWWDYWSDEPIEGPCWINYDAPLERLPLFIRGGSMIPTQEVLQWVGEKDVSEMTIEVYPGADGRGYLYQDDGETLSSPWSLTEFSLENSGRRLVIKTDTEGTYDGKDLVLKVHGLSDRRAFTLTRVNGRIGRGEWKDGCLLIDMPDDGSVEVYRL
jgi:alpha-glucosidase